MLRNPIVVGLLVVIALVVILYQVFGSKLVGVKRVVDTQAAVPAEIAAAAGGVTAAQQRMAAQQPAQPVARSKTAVPKLVPIRATTYTNLEAALLPRQSVEAWVVEEKFKNWVAAPLRDPFLLLPPVAGDRALLMAQTNSPVKTWALQAIWNQTGTRLAVINDHVFQIGDVVEAGYKLLRIEKDEVWFQGPYQNERLGFAEPKRTAPHPLSAPPPGTTRMRKI